MHISVGMSQNLPILPMRNGVLFPGMSLPITAARPQTLRAIEAALRDPEHRVLVLAQRDDQDEVTPEILYSLGTVATVGGLERGLGGVRIVLQGHERGIAVRIAPKDGYLLATVAEPAELPPLDSKDPTFVALVREVKNRAAELAKKRGVPSDAVDQMLTQITEPGQLADLVAGYLDVPVAHRQALLEATAVEDRLRRVL
ncbi:MAG: LON peptidase substrate-binding domain-containing protein, partial [Gemmatimonadetes bacterium]|nr:LON peptidase substrate-binding domain-containing protein [Gemmatimonadota bacterium]